VRLIAPKEKAKANFQSADLAAKPERRISLAAAGGTQCRLKQCAIPFTQGILKDWRPLIGTSDTRFPQFFRHPL
jgi:hypothetical protein